MRKTQIFCFWALLLSQVAVAQIDSIIVYSKPDPFQVLEEQKRAGKKSGTSNFKHWMYSEKTHAVVGYLGSIAQAGFSDGESTDTWHYDLGALYMGKWVKSKNYKLNFHAWVEHTNLVTGSDPKKFAENLNMISVPNASDAEGPGYSLEYFHAENFFFDGFLDVTVGKLEPTFYISFTPYTAWDKLNLFSKTSSSDPVPDMEGGFGFFTELNFSDYISVGAQIHDDNPRNDYFDPGNFFGNTTRAYQTFVRWGIPSEKKRFSYHILNYYTHGQSGDRAAGEGWMYIGNQGISERVILTLKLSNGSGRVLKYNGAYAAGLIFLNPFQRPGDQTGASFVINEKSNNFEYGIDTYYSLFLAEWINVAASFQAYYTVSDNIAVIPGIRAMITY